jgi:hypothetical protein
MRYAVIAPGATHGRLVTVRQTAGGLEAAEEPAPAGLLATTRDAGFTEGAVVVDIASVGSVTGEPEDDPLAQFTYAGPELEALHADYVAQGRVDDRAPTQAAGEIAIDAPPARVWATLAEVEGFTWRAGPNQVTSRFGMVEPGRRLTWTTAAPGARLAHVYDFTPSSTGTLLRCRESLAAPILARFIPSTALQAGVNSWLSGVKAVAET